jgi:hypothetical protein
MGSTEIGFKMIANRKKTGPESIPARLRELGYSSYQEYLNSKHWKEVRQRYFRSKLVPRNILGDLKCAYCEETTGLAVHHLTYKSLGNERLHHLILLCRYHHEKAHEINREVGKDLWKSTKASRTPKLSNRFKRRMALAKARSEWKANERSAYEP